MVTTPISSAGAHAFGASTDRIPVSKGPFPLGTKGYQSQANLRRPYVIGRTPANLGRFWRRLRRTLEQPADFTRINLLGDSITLGSGGDFQRNSISEKLAALFRSKGLVTRAFKHGLHGSAAGTATFDSRYAFSGTWGDWGQLPMSRCTSASGTLTYTPGYSHDTVDVLWYRDTVGNGGGGDMTITVDGGATNFSTPTSGGSVASETISQSGAASLQKTTVTIASAGTHAITITNGASNNIQIYGFEAYNVSEPTVIIRNMGISGYTSSLWNVSQINSALFNAALTADLTMLNLGSNDTRSLTVLGTYSANIAATRASVDALSTSSVLYWTWPPEVISGGTALATQQSYVDALIAAGGVNTVVVDVWRRWVDAGGQEALATNMGGLYDDTIHPNSCGSHEIADLLFDTIFPSL